ncbi:MAG: hypothetical protein U9N31_04335, partial [Candidatus Marinimicrobia bacterium]|nr:hypothetical protein [Candidatus Neomarinimicrobiota bacterium]
AIPDRSDYALKGQLIILNPGVGNLKCNLSKKNVRHSVADTLIQFGLDRWSRRMKYYGTADWKTRILEDSFKLLGKGGNEKQFLKLLRFFKNGLRLGDPNLNEISWRYRRIRPNAWPEKRMDIAYQLYDWIEKEVWVHRLDLCFLERIVSHGLAVELVGNIFNPMAAQRCLAAGNISGFRSCKEEWLDLKLGYSYGRFEKQFHGLLTSRQLKSFPVLQGLIALEKLFCKNRHCLVCPLKQTHGTA